MCVVYSERDLERDIQFLEDRLLRSKDFREQIRFHETLIKMRKQLSALRNKKKTES